MRVAGDVAGGSGAVPVRVAANGAAEGGPVARGSVAGGSATGGVAVHRRRRVSTAPGRRVRAARPRPVRPGVVRIATRPVQPARPGAGGRVLVRLPPRPLPRHIRRRRRFATAIGTMLLTAAVVLLLGLLADAVAVVRQGSTVPPPGGHSLAGVLPAPGQVPPARLG